MPFNDTSLFKPIDVTVDPWQIVTGTITTSTSNGTSSYVYTPSVKLPEVKEVIFAPPATIVYWKDGSRSVVKCSDDDYFDEEMGFALCFMKKILSTSGYKKNMNTYIRNNIKNAKRYYHVEPLFETPIKNMVKAIKDAFKEKL